jgi:hypothetical protein
MFWTVEGANAIIALRCCLFNGRFESYWDGPEPPKVSRLCRREIPETLKHPATSC